MSLLKGKVAVVTGGSRGIGRAIAEGFARVGATVIICGRTQSTLNAVARDNEYLPGRIVPFLCNVTRLAELEHMVETIQTEQGHIDVLVNNAAQNIYGGYALDLGDTEFDRAVEANVKNVYRLTRLVAPRMCARGKGSIINIAAAAASKPEPENLLFSMTKAAVISLTRSYALELAARGVRVNAIAPGLVQTDSSRTLWQDEERLAQHMALQPLRHLGQPEEIAEIAVLLASERASLVTGQVFTIDAGMSLV